MSECAWDEFVKSSDFADIRRRAADVGMQVDALHAVYCFGVGVGMGAKIQGGEPVEARLRPEEQPAKFSDEQIKQLRAIFVEGLFEDDDEIEPESEPGGGSNASESGVSNDLEEKLHCNDFSQFEGGGQIEFADPAVSVVPNESQIDSPADPPINLPR